MKNIPFVVATMFAILGSCALPCLSGCFTGGVLLDLNENLTVTVLTDPVGGHNVSTISSTYNVKYKWSYPPDAEENGLENYRSAEGIDLNVYFINDKGEKHNAQTKHFATNNSDETFDISFSAPSGLYLDKTFWVNFDWLELGHQGKVSSKKAVCTVP